MDGCYAPEQEACRQNTWAWVWGLVDCSERWMMRAGPVACGPETREVVEIGRGFLEVVVRFWMGTGVIEAGTWPEVGGCGGLLTVGCFLRT